MMQADRNQRPFLLKGDYVWIEPEKPGEFAVSIGAKVVTSTSGKIQILDDDGKEHWVDGTRKLRHMHVSSIEGVEDMIGLGDLHESGILRNLLIRYMDHNIYTYTGSILVAVNPYEILPIYTPEKIQLYRDRKIGELPPHIFAIADNSYGNMMRYQHDQCVIISGESGAGKTESTKLILQFLAAVSGQHSWIEQQILEANPIMEAFGNAKTIRNDNSSRFGKYIDIHFNEKGVIEGAKIEQYLLEKSRIVSQMQDERNYHIFYCMLAGMSKEERAKLELLDARYYMYLIQGGSVVCDSRNDSIDFKAIKSAMKVLVFDDSEIWEILVILASLLHLGNVKYNEIEIDHLEATEIQDISYINKVARLLDMNAQSLVDALTTRTIVTRGEKVNFTMNKGQSLDVRDAFVKGIYGRLFIWIVEKINVAIFKEKGSQYRKSIGVLDIFGFENFGHNSFEQLCINYANENLQQFFVRHIFKLEQAEYNLEGINWQHIEFLDNQDSLDLIAAKPMNVMALIDEESMFPKGTDQSLLNKLHQYHSGHSKYLKAKSAVSQVFGIDHFAGVVLYDTRGFLEKNRDTFSSDLISVIQSSKNKFLKVLFSADISVSQKKKSPTLATQFKKSLEQLMTTLSSCQPFFVRCIKPNEFKKPLMFERSLCCKQLRYSGMMETIRIRRAGYPIRHQFVKFVDRYRMLVNGIGPSHKEDCKAASSKICSVVLKNADYQLGHTKVFLKDAQDVYLEQQRDITLAGKILTIQTMVRCWHHRSRFLKMRKCIVTVQSTVRAYLDRRRYIVMRQGYMRLQAMIRTRLLTARLNRIRGWVVNLQAVCRGYLAREWTKKKPSAIYHLQSAVKTIIAKAQLKKLRLARIQGGQPNNKQDANKKPKQWNDQGSDTPTDFLVPNDPRDPFKDELQYIKDLEQGLNTELGPGIHTFSTQPPRKPPSEHTFAKYAKSRFMNNATHTYIRRILKQPLLRHDSEGDQLAALAVWIVILRFMGDLPEPRYLVSERKDNTPMMTKIYSTLGRKFGKHDLEQAMKMGEQMEKEFVKNNYTQSNSTKSAHKLYSLTLKKRSKITDDVKQGFDGNTDQAGNILLDDRPMSNLEKLHFIIGHGILRPELRDEIYCQICKQLTNNHTTHARGWILLCLCLCCFPPSQEFSPFLHNFIEGEGPPGYAPYCLQRLTRTEKNGPRNQPPSWIELEASKSKKDIHLTITFMDNVTRTLTADSATTAHELCEQLAQEVGLKDQFGFSLYVALFDKVSSLGSRGDHVMDAISQCEQYAKEQGAQEKNAPWKLFFRKEIFAPWHDSGEDQVATNLIFQQVVRGIKFGEYKCDKDDDLAMIAAQQYYIEHRLNIDHKRLQTLLTSYIPDSYLHKADSLQSWVNSVRAKLQGQYFQNSKIEPSKVKEDIVTYARYKWPLLFSRFYEAKRLSGPSLPKNDILIAVNWTGVYVIDDQEKVLLELSFPEIKDVNSSRAGKIHGQSFSVATVRGDEYVFTSPNAEDIKDLTQQFLDGLRKRSKYMIAIEDFSRDGESLLAAKKGDLIFLHSVISGEPHMGNGWCEGENLNSKRKGDFPAQCVYVLPTITRPPQEILNLFLLSGTAPKQPLKQPRSNEGVPLQLHTLEQFSIDHFRPPPKRTISRTLNVAQYRRSEELWRYSREPLKQPLLKKLTGQEQCAEACACFLNILKYMGDHPSRRGLIASELTDQIFADPIKQEILRDEIYCQIMKQLTDNMNSVSEERGWELMWLVTGCFPPSSSLLKELTAFLQTRTHIDIVHDILSHLQKSLRNGARKYPPHQVEVEAIQHRTTQIIHKIYFPDDSEEAYEVDASTRAKDFCQSIANKLGLKSAEGFSLFVKIADKVISIPDGDFFFDFVRHLTDYIRKSRPAREGTPATIGYQVLFMKKLWLRTVPGKDTQADVIFHYHQELPKYLRGYHKCTRDDAAQLGALVYRVRHGEERAYLNKIQEILQFLIPADLVKAQSSDEWRKSITSAYSKDTGKSINDSKISFLNRIYQWPMFGSAFFEVKQMTDPSYPENLLLAINKNGVNIIDPHTKDLKATHPFSNISNWSSGNTYFHMTIGNLVRGSKLLCETSLGYKMDDLLTSYISLMLSNINRSRRGQRI